MFEFYFPGQVGADTASAVHTNKALHSKFIRANHRFRLNRNGTFKFRTTTKDANNRKTANREFILPSR